MTNEPTRTRRFITAIRTRAWLWLLPTVIGFSGAAIWSARTPELYRSSAVITVVPSKVPGINATDLDRAPSMAARLPQVKNEILSRTRLERVIRDLDLYAAERRTGIMEDIVGRMRSMIGLSADGPSITVSFTTDNPRQAQRVTERLAALFMDEWTRDRKLLVENTDQFLQTRLSDMRDKLVKAEENLARARRTMAPGASVTPEALELESTKAEYQKLLTLRQQAQTAADIERREIGETFKLVDGARVPEVPIGPARGLVKLVATLSGLAIGLLLVGLSAGKAEHGSSAHAVPT